MEWLGGSYPDEWSYPALEDPSVCLGTGCDGRGAMDRDADETGFVRCLSARDL